MHDAQDLAPEGDGSRAATSDEIARSLGSVWQRFSGVRPKSTSIEIDRDAVRCLIEEGAPDPTIADGDDGAHGPSPTPDSSAFQRDSSAAVTRATGRRVVAFIPKRDAKAGTAKQTFILDRPRERF